MNLHTSLGASNHIVTVMIEQQFGVACCNWLVLASSTVIAPFRCHRKLNTPFQVCYHGWCYLWVINGSSGFLYLWRWVMALPLFLFMMAPVVSGIYCAGLQLFHYFHLCFHPWKCLPPLVVNDSSFLIIFGLIDFFIKETLSIIFIFFYMFRKS